MGTPDEAVLDKFKKVATHMEFDFPKKEGTGIAKLIPHVSAEAQDLIQKLLVYGTDGRISASQALKHSYFKELREAD